VSQSYIIGDIHGCFYTFKALLKQLAFNPNEDRLLLLGDLIGKGKYSHLVLDYVTTLPYCQLVLGNHEIAWLRSYTNKHYEREDLQNLSQYSNAEVWYQYLLKMPFLIRSHDKLIVHAAIHYAWHIDDAFALSKWLSRQLQAAPALFFQSLRKPPELRWHEGLTDSEKRYLALQIFTRCRYYDHEGLLDLTCTDAPEFRKNLIPWYKKTRKINNKVCFGHWASLKGRVLDHDNALDGGALYGGSLIALNLLTNERFYQKKVAEDE